MAPIRFRRKDSEFFHFLTCITLSCKFHIHYLDTIISFANPMYLSLNLILSTSTLVYINFRYQNRKALLINFTHFMGLITIASCVNWLFPQFSYDGWILITLGLMVAESSIAHIGYNQKSILEKNKKTKTRNKPNL